MQSWLTFCISGPNFRSKQFSGPIFFCKVTLVGQKWPAVRQVGKVRQVRQVGKVRQVRQRRPVRLLRQVRQVRSF
jgi:hypothetical protein